MSLFNGKQTRVWNALDARIAHVEEGRDGARQGKTAFSRGFVHFLLEKCRFFY